MEKPISARANDHAEGCKILVERRNKNGGGGGALFLFKILNIAQMTDSPVKNPNQNVILKLLNT